MPGLKNLGIVCFMGWGWLAVTKKFAEYWKDKGYEKGQSQTFWIELLQKVLGVESPTKSIEFEKPVIVEKNQKYIYDFA